MTDIFLYQNLNLMQIFQVKHSKRKHLLFLYSFYRYVLLCILNFFNAIIVRIIKSIQIQIVVCCLEHKFNVDKVILHSFAEFELGIV